MAPKRAGLPSADFVRERSRPTWLCTGIKPPKRRKRKRKKRCSWNDLPTEIKQQILGHVVLSAKPPTAPTCGLLKEASRSTPRRPPAYDIRPYNLEKVSARHRYLFSRLADVTAGLLFVDHPTSALMPHILQRLVDSLRIDALSLDARMAHFHNWDNLDWKFRDRSILEDISSRAFLEHHCDFSIEHCAMVRARLVEVFTRGFNELISAITKMLGSLEKRLSPVEAANLPGV